MEWISDPTAWSALAALLTLEIVLGVDNVVFISILASKLPAEQQDKARKIGLLAAGGMRVILLLAVGWIITLKKELFSIGSVGFSGKELILLAGGLFLIYKATKEIHHKLEGEEGTTSAKTAPTIAAVIGQVLLLDMVFSIDSVIKAIYTFVNSHPSVKILALAFLLLIGVTLIAEGFGEKIPKGYIYASMTFSVFVEVLNLRVRSKKKAVEPVHLREPIRK